MHEHNQKSISFSQLANLILAVFLLFGIAATTYTVSSLRDYSSEAARGGKFGGSTASISLDQTYPHLGDTVTFTTSGGRRIALACYQGGLGNMVYSVDQAVGTSFLLSSPSWSTSGEDASCYAWLYNRDLSKGALATAIFTVTP